MVAMRIHFRPITLLLLVGMLGGCASSQTSSTGFTTESGIAKFAVNAVSYPLERTVYWGAWVAAAYLVLDPLSPNWEVQEARFPEDHVHFQMTMKRFYTGGAGEARVTFHRRAKELMRAGGFNGYEVVDYREGMESSVLGSQRTVEGVVRFSRTPPA
jgi:hypothetical protein